jgi:hypothetical protein
MKQKICDLKMKFFLSERIFEKIHFMSKI